MPGSAGSARTRGLGRSGLLRVRNIRALGGLAFVIATMIATAPGASAAQGSGEWRSLAPVPARFDGVEGMSVGRLDGTIVAAYGYDGGDTRLTRIYDISTDTWSTGAQAPGPPRSEGAAVAHGSFVYAVGGRASNVLASLDRYSVDADTWASLPDMPTPRAGLAAVVVGNSIYAIGGRDATGGPCSQGQGGQLATVERFDIAANDWTTVAELPRARSDLAAAVVGNTIYVFGGCRVGANGLRFLRSVDAYDPSTDSWSRAPANLPTARAAMYSVATLGGTVHVIGGWAGGGPLGTHEVYSAPADAYTEAAEMLTARGEMGVVAAGGRIYAVGGALPAFGVSSDANEVFIP
jgi:hypothetical protein